MALVKAVPDDAVRVEITEMVNAGTFWVVSNTRLSEKNQIRKNSWSNHYEQLETMEMFLATARLTATPKRHPPSIKEFVAVNNYQTGKWHRGRIEALPRFGDEDYKVFLIDHGRTIEAPASAIRDIDEFYTKKEPHAFMIILVGVVPAKSVAFNPCRENLVEMPQWSVQANMFVKNQIAKSSIGYFCQKDENEMNDVKCGELFLVTENGFIDLGLLLCWKNYAISANTIFKAKENYSNSNEEDYVEFQKELKIKKGKRPQNVNHPVGKEFLSRTGVNTEEEKKSALKAVTEMYESLRKQEFLQTNIHAGNVDKEVLDEDAAYNKRKTRIKPTFLGHNHANRTQTKSIESSKRSDISHGYYYEEKLLHDHHDLTLDVERTDEYPACLVTHSERDVRQKSFSAEKNAGSRTSGDCSEQFKSQGHHKEKKYSQLYYVVEDENSEEDISHGVKFDRGERGKTTHCFDSATETSSVDSSARYIEQNLTDEYKSCKALKSRVPLFEDRVCGEYNLVCDERNGIKKSFPHEDFGNRENYPKNSNFDRKSDVSKGSQEFQRRNNLFAKHNLSQDDKKSYKESVAKRYKANHLRNNIEDKETFSSLKDSDKPSSLRDTEMFDENSSNSARYYERELEIPYVLPHNNRKIVMPSKRCDVYEVPEKELKNSSVKCSTLTKCGEDFDSDRTSSERPSVKGRVKSKPILTFFPAGFNMGEADWLFAEKISPLAVKQKNPSNSTPKFNSLQRDTDTRSPGYANRNGKDNSGDVSKFACRKIDQQNKLERKSYDKQNKLQKCINGELKEERSCSNSEISSRKEIEKHLSTSDGIITSLPKSKQQLLVNSPHKLYYYSNSEDHESIDSFYREPKKDADQMIEFISDRKLQQNKIKLEEQNKFPKYMNVELDEDCLHSSIPGEHGRREVNVDLPIGGGIMTFSPKSKQNRIVNSPLKLSYSSGSQDHKSLNKFYRSPEEETEQTHEFVCNEKCEQIQSEPENYGKRKFLQKHMRTELDNEHLFLSKTEEYSREEVEVNVPVCSRIMTSPPERKPNHIVYSPPKLYNSSGSKDHKSLDKFHNNSKKESGQINKFVPGGMCQNLLKLQDYSKQNRFPVHMNAELDEEYLHSCNSREHSEEEIEVNHPTLERIMTFTPRSKQNHLVHSVNKLNYSNSSDDHESLDENNKKDVCQFVPQLNKLECKEQNKFSKSRSAELNESTSLLTQEGKKGKSICDEVASPKLLLSLEVDKSCMPEFDEKVERMKLESKKKLEAAPSSGKFEISSELETSDTFEKTSVLSLQVDKSCVPEFDEKAEQMKLGSGKKLESVPSPGEFEISSELETSDTFEKTLLPQPNIIEQRFSPEHSGQQMPDVHNIMSKDISFAHETSDRTEQTHLTQEHQLLSAIKEYIAATNLTAGNESNTIVPLLQQLFQNLSGVSVEGGAVDSKGKGMVNGDAKDSETSNTAITDDNIINSVETKEYTKESTIIVTSESTDRVSPIGLSNMQNELQNMACETSVNMPITMLSDVSEQKLEDSEPNEGSPTERNVSEIVQTDVLAEMTDPMVFNGEGDICKDLKIQDVESILEEILEKVSERVLLKEDSETVVRKNPEAEIQESLKLLRKKDSNLITEDGKSMAKKEPNIVAQEGLNSLVEENEKEMKNSLKIELEEKINARVKKNLNGIKEDTRIEAIEGSSDGGVKECISYGEVGENINVEAMGINIEVEEGSILVTEKDKIVMANENTMIQKSHDVKIKDTDIAEETVVKDSNNVVEESSKERNFNLIVTEGVNLLVKDKIQSVEDQDTAVAMKKGFVTKWCDIGAEAEGHNVLKAPMRDEENNTEGNSKCVTVKEMETILKTVCSEVKDDKSDPVEVSSYYDCPETKVMVKEIFQQIHSCLETSDKSKSISKDILESNSFPPKFLPKDCETSTSMDTCGTVKEHLVEEAQISEERNSTRNSLKHFIESDNAKVSEKPPPHRIIGVEPDVFRNAPRKIIDQLQMMIVLLHGAPEGFRHLNSVTDAAFRMDIHEVLKTIMYRMMRIQKYVWPLILQGYSVVMVGPPMSGKTLGYAVPLLDVVMQNVQCNQVQKGNGPVMLVLCSGSKNCNEIQGIFYQFTKNFSKSIKTVVAYSGGTEKIELNLVNGCHILISTPRCFKRLYGFGKVVLNFQRLKYLVLDEADILTLRFLPEIEYILKCLERDMKLQDKAQLQVVAAAGKWCPGFDGLVKNLIKPVVCIAAFLEALVYAHFKPHVHYVTYSNRVAIVKEIIEKSYENHRTLILCREVDEVKTLKNVLKFCHHLLYVHDDMDARDVHEVYLRWSCMTQSVLVCTDNIFQEMLFQGVSQVVHFSLGDISKREFACRCSAIIDRLPSIFENQEKKKTDVEPEMHIFISDTDSEPLPTLVSLLKRLGIPVDPDLQKRANEAECMKEIRKDCVPLCYNTKAFGDCWNRSKCIYRHVICNKDEPQNIPVSGTVKVKILYVHDACNYSARLLEHVNKNGEVRAITNCLVSISQKLRLYFKVEEHRILLENPKAHDICAFEKHVGMFLRTEILAITKTGRNHHPTELLVRYIDDGGRDVIKADEVFVLPEDLKEIPPQSVELYLCRLVPCDLDWSWGAVTNEKVASILAEADQKGRFLIGKIKLSLGHILWLDPLECFESLGMLKTSTIIFSLRRKLLEEGLAVENPQHLQLLYQACIRGGLDVSCTDTSDASLPAVKSEEKEETISWAHLPVDEFSLVYFIVGDHPGRFYVRQKKFEDLVYKLDKKLLKFVEEKGATDRTLFTGDYCIGKFPIDNRWYRARVERAQDDTLDLFFVDHGDRATVSRSEAFPLPKNFISQLPFQAIECCFAGVGPDMGDMWSEKSLETLYGITSKPGTVDGVKLLYAKVMDKVKPADCTGGYKYHVALIEVTPHGKALLNESLVAWKVATQTEEQRLFLKKLDFSHLVPPLDLEPYESEEDEDEAEEPHLSNVLNVTFQDNWDNVQEVSPLSTLPVDANMSGQSCSSNVTSNSEKSLVPMNIDFDFDAVTEEEYHEFYLKTMESYFDSQNKESRKNTTSSPDKIEKEEENKLKEIAATSLDLEDPKLQPLNEFEYSKSSQVNYLNDVMEDDCSMPPLERKTRTPLIYWHQNPYFVWLRVDLPGVEKYHLKWSTDNLHFWTAVNELIYTFDLNLFGPIKPCNLQHSGGLFVRIKMQKVAVGLDWLRLTEEQTKCPWIKRDYEAENDSDIEDLHLSEQLRAVKEMEKKTAAQNHGDGLLPADEVPYECDDDDDSDSSCSDIKLPGDEQYDPYDPLN